LVRQSSSSQRTVSAPRPAPLSLSRLNDAVYKRFPFLVDRVTKIGQNLHLEKSALKTIGTVRNLIHPFSNIAVRVPQPIYADVLEVVIEIPELPVKTGITHKCYCAIWRHDISEFERGRSRERGLLFRRTWTPHR
jgi:hypothetical protein